MMEAIGMLEMLSWQDVDKGTGRDATMIKALNRPIFYGAISFRLPLFRILRY
jgi:hypothetical protein